MVSSRKRKRSPTRSNLLNSTHDYKGVAPPPFAPARLSLLKAYRSPLPRNLQRGLSPAYVNLVLMAGERLRARDFASAAAALPALFKRYRKSSGKRWFFTREIALTGAEVLRRASWKGHAEMLDAFLAQMSRDGHLSSRHGREGYAAKAREAVLLERAMQLLAGGNVRPAFECLYEQSQDKLFRDSALVHGYLGMLALAVSAAEDDPSVLLRVAAGELSTAAEIEPTAYFYVYYAAAAAMAAGKRDDALAMLRRFVHERNRTDPIALYGVLACLEGLDERDSDPVRQERVDIARRLLLVDPLSVAAMDLLREAHAWAWPVVPRVTCAELADALGSRIEHGDVADVATWTALGFVLGTVPAARKEFWQFSGRCAWWPSHFFRVSKLNADITANPRLASAKGAVAKILAAPDGSPYAEGVEGSGVVQLLAFEDNTSDRT